MSFFSYSDELPAWIGTPPESWGKNWLKWSVSLSTERPNEQEQSDLPYLSNEDIESWTGKLLRDELESSESDSRKFKAGDVLFNKLRPYLAKAFHADFSGVSSGELLCLRSSSRVVPRYLFYLVTSKGFIDAVDAETFGSKMPRADWEIVGHQPLPLPPLDTQHRIAQFLDEKIDRIDGLIEKKRALLNRLAEKRQALITRAVTKGLNPDAPMRPSEIDWLGDIPAHWEIKQIKHSCRILRGKFSHRPRNAPHLYNGEYPFIQTGDVARADKYVESYAQTLSEEGYAVSKEFPEDTLCMAIAANVGDVAILRFKACFPDSVVGFVPGPSTELDYLYFLFAACVKQFEKVSVTNTQANLNIDRIGGLMIPIPPPNEQAEISSLLNGEDEEIRQISAEINRSINLLVEYRATLIAAATTGQLEVD
ncbi:restriction endonuclease subunit S [Litchfieldella xinjiangensis]|uniref:restriction endonuclease subunit S n=1 Tax=Litchfieldella xinjiangensis TaxID=1166948 RepID=UPI0009DE9475|nr:restriction endonuclease subunit S [Halomonas xinjiangensis]